MIDDLILAVKTSFGAYHIAGVGWLVGQIVQFGKI